MKTVIFDIDGVLSDNSCYKEWYTDGKFDPKKFKENIPNFKVLQWGKELASSLHAAGYKIILCTARRIDFMQDTIDWLKANNIRYDATHFKNVRMSPRKYKLSIAKMYKPLFIVEDKPDIVDYYRENGFTVLQPNNVFEEQK